MNRTKGPVTPYERLHQMIKYIHAERYTALDRSLVNISRLNLRPSLGSFTEGFTRI